jgi:hypothetical protein
VIDNAAADEIGRLLAIIEALTDRVAALESATVAEGAAEHTEDFKR